MSIASEITRLQNAKSSLKTAINAKNDAEHQIDDETLDDYATFVGDIVTGTDVSDTTATATDVLSGKDFYLADGTKTTGTIATYTGSTSITNNGTVATANKYITSNLTINVSPTSRTFRWANPTMIRITTTTANQEIYLKFKRVNYAISLNWGDGSSRTTVSTSSSTSSKSHIYSTVGTYTIVISVYDTSRVRFLLSSDYETQSSTRVFYQFDNKMFNQSSSNHFTPEVEIFVGDSIDFYGGALDYCDNIKTLDFSDWNSLIECPSNTYKTFKTLYTLCNNSIIKNLVLGSSISSIENNCFRDSTIENVIVKDTRITGDNQTVITLGSYGLSIPNLVTRILIQNGRLSRYQSASNWSSFSSKMYAY